MARRTARVAALNEISEAADALWVGGLVDGGGMEPFADVNNRFDSYIRWGW
jgi:hypothetical protein